MKKLFILLVLCLLFSGCEEYNEDFVVLNRFDSGRIEFAMSNDGVYFIKNNSIYYKQDNQIASCLVSFDDSSLKVGQQIVYYDNRIYLLYEHSEIGKVPTYHLGSYDLNGEDFTCHIDLEYEPHKMIISDQKIYIYNGNENTIKIYDKNFKLVDTKTYDKNLNVMAFYIEKDEIVIPEDFVIYENEDVKITYEIHDLLVEENRKVISTIQILGKKYEFENKFILYANDKYFYTASCTYPQTYERYKLNGQLDRSIVISDYIKAEGNFNHLFEMDFSYILGIRGEDIVYGSSRFRLFEVNFDTGTCQYVDL